MKKMIALLCSLVSLQLAAQNVGIGTTNPTQQLDVNGNLRVRGLSNPSGQGNSMMQVDADGTVKRAKVDTLRANPTPASTGSVATGPGVQDDYPTAVAISGNRACVVNLRSSTLQLFDISTNTPVLLGSASTDIGLLVDLRPSDVAISGTRAYVINTNNIAYLQVFDISGSAPILVGSAAFTYYGWRIIVRGTKAYITTQDNKLVVYDVSTNTPSQLGIANTGNVPADFVLSGDKAYVVNRGANKLQVFDISTNTPALLATVDTDVAPTGISISGDRAYIVNNNGKSMQVFDLASSQPALLSTIPVNFNPAKIKLSGNRAYVIGSNNMLNVFDAGGRFKPVLIGNSPFPGTSTVGRALDVTERKAYVGTSDQKLQVFELGYSGGITAQGPDGNVVVIPDASIGGDNLGDHNITQNLNLRNFQLVGNDGTSGIQISNEGYVGIGTASPHAPLQFSNTSQNRKLVLGEDQNNEHNFFGFGFNPAALRYQVAGIAGSHVFYAGASSTTSNELMRITGNGRVGIGTNNPSYKLDVEGNSRVTGDFIHTSADGGGTWVYLTNTSGVPTGWKMVTTPSPSNGIGGNLQFQNNNNSSALTVQQNGYIGVGLTNPSTLFTNTAYNILGGSGVGLGVGSMAWQTNAPGFTQGVYNQNTAYNANGLVVKIAGTAASNRILDLATGPIQDAPGTSVMVVQGDGNVGIGTGSPGQKLDVQGNISASGNFMMGLQYPNNETNLSANLTAERECNCPAGTKVIGGGGGSLVAGTSQADIVVNFSGPKSDGSGWRVLLRNSANTARTVVVWAVCARVQ